MNFIKNLKNKFKNKFISDRGDANSVSQIIWIALAAILALTVGGVIYKAVMAKGNDVGNQIKNSQTTFAK